MSLLTPPLPIILSSPSGQATLPFVEVSRADVQKKGKSIRYKRGGKKRAAAQSSFGNYQGHISFTAWRLFHAAKKTELTTTFTRAQIDHRALCFANEWDPLFVWTGGNLRRTDRSAFALENFSETGLVGRMAEAVAYLTMLNWGYVFFDRIAVLWERAAATSGMTHSERLRMAQIAAGRIGSKRPDKEPDFAFEKLNYEVALMESKGSWVHPTRDDPSTKDDLRSGLDQINAWAGMISPTPAKTYAIGTYFRDLSDASGDESLICYVDPPGEPDKEIEPVPFQRDWIRRGNYGAWLVGMGYVEAGNALRSAVEIPTSDRILPVVSFGNSTYALVVQGVVLKGRNGNRYTIPWSDDLFPMPWELDLPLHVYERLLWHTTTLNRFIVIGIESTLLREISKAVVNSVNVPLLAPSERSREDAASPAVGERQTPGFYGSTMPDGTLVGEIVPDLLENAALETFRL